MNSKRNNKANSFKNQAWIFMLGRFRLDCSNFENEEKSNDKRCVITGFWHELKLIIILSTLRTQSWNLTFITGSPLSYLADMVELLILSTTRYIGKKIEYLLPIPAPGLLEPWIEKVFLSTLWIEIWGFFDWIFGCFLHNVEPKWMSTNIGRATRKKKIFP